MFKQEMTVTELRYQQSIKIHSPENFSMMLYYTMRVELVLCEMCGFSLLSSLPVSDLWIRLNAAERQQILTETGIVPTNCSYKSFVQKYNLFFFFFLIYMGCPGQLTRTTTIPHGPLDILQAQEQVRHRGGDRRAHRGSNPGWGRNKSHDWPQQLGPQVQKYNLLLAGLLFNQHYYLYKSYLKIYF
jgi:hypothetical protein